MNLKNTSHSIEIKLIIIQFKFNALTSSRATKKLLLMFPIINISAECSTNNWWMFAVLPVMTQINKAILATIKSNFSVILSQHLRSRWFMSGWMAKKLIKNENIEFIAKITSKIEISTAEAGKILWKSENNNFRWSNLIYD